MQIHQDELSLLLRNLLDHEIQPAFAVVRAAGAN
jgi:hypothetical protein